MGETLNNFNARKVFFLYPHVPKGNTLIKNIVYREYEAYSVNSHRTVLELFNEYKDSFLFVNLDFKMNYNDWALYMSSIMDDPEKNEVKIGALTEDNIEILSNPMGKLDNFSLHCGCVDLSNDLDECTNYISEKLEDYNAKGRRKYIRAKCSDTYHATFSVKIGKEIHKGYIHDISSAGMACTFDNEIDLPANTFLEDIQLRLLGNILMASGKVIFTRDQDEAVYVIMFDYRKTYKVRNKILNFIHEVLQREMQKKIEEIERNL